jgi:two-component system CheB/CheR fusion protein
MDSLYHSSQSLLQLTTLFWQLQYKNDLKLPTLLKCNEADTTKKFNGRNPYLAPKRTMTAKKRYIIALGASAGGIAALSEFFDNSLPDGITYVITTHLYPHQKSLLSEIIQRHIDIKVCDVEESTELETNVIYVMPENKIMTLEDGKLRLRPRDLSIKVNKAIDIFFNSLANDTHFLKVAVILSGMGVDGTNGIQALSEKGAYIIAQTPLSAGQSSMPNSVIDSGYVDEILDPKHMPAAIIAYMAR